MPAQHPAAGTELGYVVLLFALFVIPKVLQRWRIPSAITSFALGAIAGLGFHAFTNDPTIHLLSTFGIVALFLFAGLEVDARELRRGARHLGQHLVLRMALLALAAWLLTRYAALAPRPSFLVALALLTPSTGFILDSLGGFGLSADEQFWVKTKAIGTELLALTLLFITLQSETALRLTISTLLLVTIVTMLPPIFRLFATKIVPYAPRSEFAFLLMMALVTAYATRQLGVYYLVGAFVVGVAARRFRQALPAMASERMLHAVEVFASFFAPFYFFGAGASLRAEDLSLGAVATGCAFFAAAAPVRYGSVMLLRRLTLGEPFGASRRIARPLLPTLVFTLVLAGILRDAFGVGDPVFGGLVIYALLTTLTPSVVFGAPVAEYEAPELPMTPKTPGDAQPQFE